MPSYGKPPALSDWLIGTHGQNTSRMTTTFYLMDKSIARKISDIIKKSVDSERAGSSGFSWRACPLETHRQGLQDASIS